MKSVTSRKTTVPVTNRRPRNAAAPFARYTLFTPNACTVEAGYILDRAVPSANQNIRVHDDGGYVALTAEHTGPFNTIGKAYEALEEFMHIHGDVSAGAGGVLSQRSGRTAGAAKSRDGVAGRSERSVTTSGEKRTPFT